MPQLFQVLRCFQCETFQVHQVKKSRKWECKMCGEKQSVKRHYGIGTGKECRLHVQKLNNIRGTVSESLQNEENSDIDDSSSSTKDNELESSIAPQTTSKWESFLDKTHSSAENSNCDSIEDDCTFEAPKRRKKAHKWQAPLISNLKRDSSHIISNKSNREELSALSPVKNISLNKDNSETNLMIFYGNSNNKRKIDNTNPQHSKWGQFIENDVVSDNNPMIERPFNVPTKIRTNLINDDIESKMKNLNNTNPQNSKWGQFIESDEVRSTNSISERPHNVPTKIRTGLIKHNVENKEKIINNANQQNSKWGQFTENETVSDKMSKTPRTFNVPTIRNKHTMFCSSENDDDLDIILDL